MINSALVAALPLLLAAFSGIAEAASCNATSPCPVSAPCCSEYGFCGTGTFCLGGCDPFGSNTLDSCRPEPICQNSNFTFADQSRILTNSTFFDGNATEYDWVVDKGNIQTSNGSLAIILTEANGGTRLSSTRFVHYGTISATLKTGRWAGVVTAFITMSDVKDEIDWEFPGANTTAGQSNYFWQGVIPTGPNNGEIHGGLTDTYSDYHTYTIDWQPDTLTWSIDGKVVRTLQKTATVNSSGIANYPSTPSRVQLSLWPAGIAGEPQGTVEWAGGMINWSDPDYVSAGHFYALVQSVSVTCTGTQTVAPGSDLVSYVYGGNRSATVPTILYTNSSTMENAASGMFGSPLGGSMGGMLAALGMGVALAVNAVLL